MHVQTIKRLLQYVHHLQGQSVISVALKRPVEIRLGIGIHKTSLLRFHAQISPHILQYNCAHDWL